MSHDDAALVQAVSLTPTPALEGNKNTTDVMMHSSLALKGLMGVATMVVWHAGINGTDANGRSVMAPRMSLVYDGSVPQEMSLRESERRKARNDTPTLLPTGVKLRCGGGRPGWAFSRALHWPLAYRSPAEGYAARVRRDGVRKAARPASRPAKWSKRTKHSTAAREVIVSSLETFHQAAGMGFGPVVQYSAVADTCNGLGL